MNPWKNTPDLSPSNGTNGTILLVDDEPLVRAMTGAVLTAMGWSVINVGSGEDAAQMLRHMRDRGHSVDLIILDLILPCGMSGLDAVRVLREIQPGVRLLACSGFFGDDIGNSPMDMGFNSMLAKPFTAEDLAHAVNHCLNTPEIHSAPELTAA